MPSLSVLELGEIIGLCLLVVLAITLIVKGFGLLNAPTAAAVRPNGSPVPMASASYGTTPSEPAGQAAFFSTTITPASNASSGGVATATAPGHRAVSPASLSGSSKGRLPYVLMVLGFAILAVTGYFAYNMWSDHHPPLRLHGTPVQVATPAKLLGMKVAPAKSPVGQMVKQMKNEDIQGGFGTTAYAAYGDIDQFLVMMVAQSDHVIGTSDDFFTEFERAIEAEAQLDLRFHPVPVGDSGGEVQCAANHDPALAVCAWVNDGFTHGAGIAGGAIFTGPIAKDFTSTIAKVRDSVEN